MTDTLKKTPLEHTTYLREAVVRPWDYGFLSLTRWVNARYQIHGEIGHTTRPTQDFIRFGQHPSLAFSPRELANVVIKDGRIKVEHYGLGLWGANGPLPLHFSEIAMHRKEMVNDNTLTNFVDIFHHRSMSLFYKAWATHQSTAGLDNPTDERFSRYIAWLTGNEQTELRSLSITDHARLSASANTITQSKNPTSIEQTLTHYFGVQFELEEYHFHWIEIDNQDRTYLGKANATAMQANSLGAGAILGAFIPDCQNSFMLTAIALNLTQYLHFLPNGKYFKQLIDWVRNFIGLEYVWYLRLTIDPKQATPIQLGEKQRLGWDSWMGQAPVTSKNLVIGVTLKPE